MFPAGARMPGVKRGLGILLLTALTAAAVYGFVVSEREASYRRFVLEGDAALARDDSYAAIEAFSVAVSLKADSMAAHLKRGEAYRRRGEYDAAVRDLRRAAEIDPLAIHPRELLGDVHYAVGAASGAGAQARFSRAVERYREAVALDDRSARLQYKLGLAAFRAGQPRAAREALRQALVFDLRFAEAHYALALCERALLEPALAARSLERAVELAPAMLLAREELADLYAVRERYEAALPHLEALAALQPSAARERALGNGYARAGQLDRAVGRLAQAAQRYPDDAAMYVTVGSVWLQRASAGGRAELRKAIEALQSGVRGDSGSHALTLLGQALLMAGDLARAEQVLLQATQRFPVEPSGFRHLADVAERRGHADVARTARASYAALVPRPRP